MDARVQRSDFSLSVFIETRDPGPHGREPLSYPLIQTSSWEVSFPLFSGLDPFYHDVG